MIVPLAKHLRKWLLRLALFAQDRIRVTAARLESTEEENAKAAEREIAPRAAKPVRTGGPPDHWVQLVKHHAPELLHPEPAYVATQTSSPAFETGSGKVETAAKNNQNINPADGAIDSRDAPIPGDLSSASKLSQTRNESDDPGSEWTTPAQDDKRQISDALGSAGAAAASPKHPRGDAATNTPAATQTGSVQVHRSPVTTAGAEKKTPKRSLNLKLDDVSAFTQGQGTATRRAETTDSRTADAGRSQSNAGQIIIARAGDKDRKNIPDKVQSGRRAEQVFLKGPERPEGSQDDAEMPTYREVDEEIGYDNELVLGESLKELKPSPGTGDKIPAPQIKSSGDNFSHINEVRINEVRKINGQRNGYLPAAREKFEETKSLPVELSWPSLPGEKDSDDVRDPHLSAAWPSLPEKRSAAVESLSNQIVLHPLEEESYKIERLRRLDEEQKGMPWSESHF